MESPVESETSSHASDADEPDDEYVCGSSGDEAKTTEPAGVTVKKELSKEASAALKMEN